MIKRSYKKYAKYNEEKKMTEKKKNFISRLFKGSCSCGGLELEELEAVEEKDSPLEENEKEKAKNETKENNGKDKKSCNCSCCG